MAAAASIDRISFKHDSGLTGYLTSMRAEVSKAVEDVQQSVGLLRRHL
jgi:hypothetical protein